MAEQIVIDEKYTYQFDEGHVQILRHGEPWLGAETGCFEGSNAWIAAANEIEDLRAENKQLHHENELLESALEEKSTKSRQLKR